MILRNYHDSRETERHVVTDGWESVRLLLKDDQMGFSFHITTIFAGKQLEMHYANHLEAVFCISGNGSILDRNTGEVHEVAPGTLYALDQNDPHILTGKGDLVLACVFNPPVTGREVHDATGAYPLDGDVDAVSVAAV